MRFPVCSLLVLICLIVSCKKQESGPTLQVKQPASTPVKSTLQKSFFLKHHFGDVDAGETLTCSLELANDTDKPLIFNHSSTSCGGCLFVKSMPKEIQPGESGIFELEFNTTGKRGATPQNAYFWDAEPKTLLIVADVGATVRAVWTDPETISLGNLSLSEPHKAKLYVMAAGFPDAKVTSIQCDASWLTLTSMPVETSKELRTQSIQAIDYYEVEWTGKDTSLGNLASKIMINVQKGDEDQTLEVPVTGYLAGDVEIIPPNIVFGRVAQNEIVRTCTLTFKKPNIDAAKIKCAADHSCIQVAFEKSKGGQLVLTAKIIPSPDIADQLLEGEIVGINESGEAIFSVPYVAFFDTSE